MVFSSKPLPLSAPSYISPHANQGNYYIAFIILSKALEPYVPQVHILNLILNYFYLGLLIMCFLLSLGNRPQGSKWGYTLAFIGFGFITIYMTVAAFLLAYKGLQSVAQSEGRAIQASDLFTNSLLTDVVLSLAATLGLYIISSLIFVSYNVLARCLLTLMIVESLSRGIWSLPSSNTCSWHRRTLPS
jgi:hypothetical protein